MARSALRSSAGPASVRGDADRRAQVQALALEHDRGGEHREDPLDERVEVGHLAGEDRELVAAQAGDGVVGPQGARSRSAADLQQAVAGGVTQGVVDPLEVVEVEEGDDRRVARLQRLGDAPLEQRAVREAGQASPRTPAGAGGRRAGAGGRRGPAGPGARSGPTTSSDHHQRRCRSRRCGRCARRARGWRRRRGAARGAARSNAGSTRASAMASARSKSRERISANSSSSPGRSRAVGGERALGSDAALVAGGADSSARIRSSVAVTSAWTASGTRRRAFASHSSALMRFA